MNKKDVAETKLKFESAYFLAQNEAPLRLFPKPLSHKERPGIMLGNAYRNRTSGNHTKNNIENFNFYGLLIDESTDSSVTEPSLS